MALAAVVLVSLVLNGVGLTWGLPHWQDWAIDSVAPYKVLEGAASFFSNGWYDKYPPLHLMLLAVLYAPYLFFLVATGGLAEPTAVFPFGLADPLGSLSRLILLARIVSWLMAAGVVLLVGLTATELFGRRAGVFAALLVTLHYPFVYHAHLATLDVPALFWATLAVRFFVDVVRKGRLRDYLLCALFATFAVCTKDQLYGLFLLSPAAVLWVRAHERRSAGLSLDPVRLLLDRRNVLALGLAVVTFSILHNLPLNASGFLKHVLYLTGPGIDPFREFSPDAAGLAALLLRVLAFLGLSLTWPLFAACLAGAVVYSRRAPRLCLPLLILAVSYVLTFLVPILYVRQRFLLPVVVILVLFGGAFLADLWDRARVRVLARAAVVAAIAYQGLHAIELDAQLLTDPRYRAERWLAPRLHEGDVVETFANPWEQPFYPRFPAHVKVRGSRMEKGERWDPGPPIRYGLQLPNLYFGRERPDFIVLSEPWYLGVQTGWRPGKRVLDDLLRGGLGYRLAARFKNAQRLPLTGIPVNPGILIFESTSTPLSGSRTGRDESRGEGEGS